MKNMSMTLSSANVAVSDGTATITASVTNGSDAPERVVLGAFPVGPPNSLPGSTGATIPDPLRTIDAGATVQFTVNFVTTGAAPGTYPVKIIPYGADEPPEDYAELGSVVQLSVPTGDGAKRFPWWIVAVAAAVLIVGGGLLLALRPWESDTASETSEVTPQSIPDTESGSGEIEEVARVPEGIVGLPLEAAVARLTSAGLEYTVEEEQVAAGSAEAGTVIRVDPEEGANVIGAVLLTVAVEGQPADTPDFVLFTVPECSVVSGGSTGGSDQLTIFVAVRNSGPAPWSALVPFAITSDTGLSAQGSTAVSTGSSFSAMQVDLSSSDFSRTHRFTAVADPDNTIEEQNESNNSVVVVVDLPERPTDTEYVPCSQG